MISQIDPWLSLLRGARKSPTGGGNRPGSLRQPSATGPDIDLSDLDAQGWVQGALAGVGEMLFDIEDRFVIEDSIENIGGFALADADRQYTL